MGEALLGGIVETGWAVPNEIVVIEVSPERRTELREHHPGVHVDPEVHTGVDAVIAVKPQYVIDVARRLGANQVTRILSIAAGVTLSAMEQAAPAAVIVRCMPNTPALVGAGASAIAGGTHSTEADLDWAESILGRVGMVVRVDESHLDAVTGVSGSGPAYVFHFAEALTAAGIAEGLTADVADALTRQTLLGAATLLSQSGEDPAVLRENVTSPGGTTAAGLAVFSDANFPELIRRVVKAAADRSRELGA